MMATVIAPINGTLPCYVSNVYRSVDLLLDVDVAVLSRYGDGLHTGGYAAVLADLRVVQTVYHHLIVDVNYEWIISGGGI